MQFEVIMKSHLFLVLILLTCLFSPTLSYEQAPSIPSASTIKEYNLAFCQPKGMGIIHAIRTTNDGKEAITFTYTAEDKNSMVEVKDPAVFNITSDTPNLNQKGAMDLDGEASIKNTKIEMIASTYQDRIVGMLTASGYFIGTIYGQEGTLDHALDTTDDKLSFCETQVSGTYEETLDSLDNWLRTGKIELHDLKPAPDQKTNKLKNSNN